MLTFWTFIVAFMAFMALALFWASLFFLLAARVLLTILPNSVLVRVALVSLPAAFAFLSEKIASLARLPFALTLTFLTFVAFLAAACCTFQATKMASSRCRNGLQEVG